MEVLYRTVQEKANKMGMKVNNKKTQLLCMSANPSLQYSSFIETPEGTRIVSGQELKILGFRFGVKPNADAQVEALKRKFYSRLWLLRHLKNSGVPNLDILSMYNCLLRPILDYAAPIYHPLLTKTQEGSLEQLQARAFKIIFGWNVSYKAALNLSLIHI